MIRSPQNMGSVLRRERRRLEMTQQDLAQKICSRQATISSVESGEPGTHLKTLFDILAALDLELTVRPRTKGSVQSLEDWL